MFKCFLLCVVTASAVRLEGVSVSHTRSFREILNRSLAEHLDITKENLQWLAEKVAAKPLPGQNMVSKVMSAATESGLQQKLEGTARKLSLTEELVDQGRRKFSADMMFIGLQIHVGVPTVFGPGLDIAFFVAYCISDDGCKDDRPWTDSSRKVPRGTAKACGGVMGGGEPILFNWPEENTSWNGFMAPADIEIVPLLIAGFGGYKYANGAMAEFGGNFMNAKFELAGAVEMNPSDLSDGIHLVVFELSWVDWSHKFSDNFRAHTKAEHKHKPFFNVSGEYSKLASLKLNAAGIGVLGYMECTCPSPCPPPGKH